MHACRQYLRLIQNMNKRQMSWLTAGRIQQGCQLINNFILCFTACSTWPFAARLIKIINFNHWQTCPLSLSYAFGPVESSWMDNLDYRVWYNWWFSAFDGIDSSFFYRLPLKRQFILNASCLFYCLIQFLLLFLDPQYVSREGSRRKHHAGCLFTAQNPPSCCLTFL